MNRNRILIIMIFPVFLKFGYSQSFLEFNNLNLGLGMNSSEYAITIPEIPGYEDNAVRKSLYIDFQFEFKTRSGINFKPGIGFWSWGVFPGRNENQFTKTVDNFTFNFDFTKDFFISERFILFGGAGLAMQYVGILIKPPERYYYIYGLSQITENYIDPGYNLIFGQKLEIISDFFLNIHVKKEISKHINQWKIFFSISMF